MYVLYHKEKAEHSYLSTLVEDEYEEVANAAYEMQAHLVNGLKLYIDHRLTS
jgi:hypothetical protein